MNLWSLSRVAIDTADPLWESIHALYAPFHNQKDFLYDPRERDLKQEQMKNQFGGEGTENEMGEWRKCV